jgi:hypothetical protein
MPSTQGPLFDSVKSLETEGIDFLGKWSIWFKRQPTRRNLSMIDWPNESRVRTVRSLQEYFRKRLHRSAERLRLRPHEDTLWYLGNLLDRFAHSEQLFEYHNGRRVLQPLALLYGEAIEASTERERCLLLQRLGDLSLFLGAFFPERYARRGISRDYFVGMGGGAYDYLSERAPGQRHIFDELTCQFTRMLELISDAASRRSRFSHGEVLRLYARWRDTGNPRLAAQLRALGIELTTYNRSH